MYFRNIILDIMSVTISLPCSTFVRLISKMRPCKRGACEEIITNGELVTLIYLESKECFFQLISYKDQHCLLRLDKDPKSKIQYYKNS